MHSNYLNPCRRAIWYSAALVTVLPLLSGCGRGPTEGDKQRLREGQFWQQQQQAAKEAEVQRAQRAKEEEEQRQKAAAEAEQQRKKQQAEDHKAWLAKMAKEAEEHRRQLAPLLAMGEDAVKLPSTVPTYGSMVLPLGLQGTALVYDAQHKQLSAAQAKLPSDIKGGAKDADLHIFVVTKTNRELIAKYNFPGPSKTLDFPVYQAEMEVRVVAWRTRSVLGIFKVRGAYPPDKIRTDVIGVPIDPDTGQPVTKYEYVGDTVAPLAGWVTVAFTHPWKPDGKEKAENILTAWAELFVQNHVWLGPKKPAWTDLGTRLKNAAQGPMWQRYAYVQVLRHISGNPMGPTSRADYDRNPGDWDRRWLDWIERQSTTEGER